MRFLATLAVLATVGSFALADIAPPPPPKGKKYVNVVSQVKLGKDAKVSGYSFLLEQVQYRPAPVATVSKVELSAEKATAANAGGRRSYAVLYAVPDEAAKEYKTEKELMDAVKGKKVKGGHFVGFEGTATVSDTVKGESVTWTYTVTGVDEKGIQTDVSGDGVEEKKGEPKKPLAVLDQPGYLIGGLALAVSVTFGGLWLLRRKK